MDSSVKRGTWIGSTALLMWSTLALLTSFAGPIPPFQLLSLTFSLGTLIALAKWALYRENPIRFFKLPLRAWMVGVGGLFGYHLFYFLAIRWAPPVEASLICYLWPLFLVLGTVLVSRSQAPFRWQHLAGVGLGFLGTAVLVAKDQIPSLSWEFSRGYLCAFSCAVIWAAYSILSRRLREIRSDAVGAFCALTAVLACFAHFLFGEPTVWPTSGFQWLAVVLLGLFPMGAAFFTWDFGVKEGNLTILGLLSYATPLASTLLLILFGFADLNWNVAGAAVLIALGSFVGSR